PNIITGTGVFSQSGGLFHFSAEIYVGLPNYWVIISLLSPIFILKFATVKAPFHSLRACRHQ
ncbi:MAG: hypothetical protein K2G17_04540, partial [Duncaniella sp.]|nr:hypothetical protein [Duncaniella sp.]